MADAGKYGKIDIPGIDEDEPVFILRAQDQLSPEAIQLYRVLCASHSSPERHLEGLDERLQEFLGWQYINFAQIPQSEPRH